eukprot:scaffold75763_cov20-Tisochrysis_lutea.AAC.1
MPDQGRRLSAHIEFKCVCSFVAISSLKLHPLTCRWKRFTLPAKKHGWAGHPVFINVQKQKSL